ncbi:hypothetical protein [Desulfoluna sp.]|uniref:hypothetical protein n=1 Tax=Desulfoluna sp. TaxID=2045199 RepID=UPI00260D27AA|nr:hypothetical protein [Desulfoluna sp.]
MKNRLTYWVWPGMVVLLAFFLVACEKERPERALIVGPWKETIASFHTIISFRSNGSFGILRLAEGQLSKIDETAERVKVEGKWKLVPPEMEGDPLLLIMMPEVVEGETPWVAAVPVTYIIERVSQNHLLMRSSEGGRIAWDRLRGTKAPEETGGIPMAHVGVGPLVVGLNKVRLNEESRYLCVQLDLVISDVEAVNCVEANRLPTGEPSGSYRIHPSLQEAIVLHLSRLRYRDVRSLNLLNSVTTDLKRILEAYLVGHLQEVKVVRVVVTTTRSGVENFVNEFAQEPMDLPEAGS